MIGFDRYLEMLGEAKVGWSLRTDALRWRVSPDMADKALVAVGQRPRQRIERVLGYEYTIDPALPPNSIILEPVPSDATLP